MKRMDKIKNRHTHYEICPNCGMKKMRVQEWEEHLEGWGFESYKVNYYRVGVCTECWYDLDSEQEY